MFAIFCHFRIFRNFLQFLRNWFLLVHFVCLLVPCVSPVQKCCSLRLRDVWVLRCNFPAVFRNWI